MSDPVVIVTAFGETRTIKLIPCELKWAADEFGARQTEDLFTNADGDVFGIGFYPPGCGLAGAVHEGIDEAIIVTDDQGGQWVTPPCMRPGYTPPHPQSAIGWVTPPKEDTRAGSGGPPTCSGTAPPSGGTSPPATTATASTATSPMRCCAGCSSPRGGHMSRVDLESLALDVIPDAITDGEVYVPSDLRRQVEEGDYIDSAADGVAIYTSDALDLIDEYESHPMANFEGYGKEYSAADWRQALHAYAEGLAYSVVYGLVQEALEAIEEVAGDVADDAKAEGCPDFAEIHISRDCPYGWASHDEELVDDTHIWRSRQLDGCNAVSRNVAGVWLTVTWDPDAKDEEEEDPE